MNFQRIGTLLFTLCITASLLGCGVAPNATPESTDVLGTSTPTLASPTEEPTPLLSPTETASESEQSTEIPYQPEKQPAAVSPF